MNLGLRRMIVMFVRSVVRSGSAERRVGLAGVPLLASEVCVAELCATGASSYSIDFTCVIGTVCVALIAARQGDFRWRGRCDYAR